MLDGLGKIDDLINKAVDFKMPALALTDHGVMYGAVEFYKKCRKAGIKPIIGLEAYVAKGNFTDKGSQLDNKPYHLILLAKDEQGYKNLVKLTSLAHLQGFYYKPRIDFNLLTEYHQGLICSTACLAGEMATYLTADNLAAAKDMIHRYQALFGQDNFFLEVQHNPNLPAQDKVNQHIYDLSQSLGVPIIATNDVHYVEKDDDQYQDILLCIQTKKTLADEDRLSMMGEDFSFLAVEEMQANFTAHPEAIANTLKIADACNFEMKLGQTVLPHFRLPEGKNADEYLKDLCQVGAVKRFQTQAQDPEVQERLTYELSVIQETGYAGYFLIVADFINWAKDHGVIVGPGRGSAAGSLVSFLIGITNIDPIKYDLVFERFLNPERVSMPDIDTDFADARRDDVLKYVTDKYGQDQVAQIITFGTMAARAAVRDVGRVMGLPYTYCDKVAKLIPMFTKLKDAIESVDEFKAIMQEEDGRKLIKAAGRLEGVVRHASTHACGVVITPQSLDNYSPRQFGSGGENSVVVQYEGHSVEDLGLLKMDFLGLSNLTIIEQTLKIIRKIHAKDIDIEAIPLDDKQAFELFQQGKTTGVFQLESAGMKRYLKQLLPTDLEDIIAMVALYRPGPMEYIPDYINGKHGRKKIEYLHPKLEPILKKTYGVAVYQEQLLQIARDLAGFTYGEADILRKAVGKKIKELLDEQEVKVIEGMIKNGINKKIARKIWEFILPFASYGFNRSHAACYAMIAYQTAYLKANYPAEFMAALLTADFDNSDRIAIEVEECRQMGIEVLPPDVNESFGTFAVVADSLKTDTPRIRFGLKAVKGLGENIVQAIIEERKLNGPYYTLEDFLTRVKNKDLNKKSLESLVKSGSLDSLGSRNQLLDNMDKVLNFVQEVNRNYGSGQDSLFVDTDACLHKLILQTAPDLEKRQQLAWEKEFLGIYVSDHPMSEFQDKLKQYTASCLNLKQCANQAQVRLAGIITFIKKIQTKKGENMLFAKIEDTDGDVEVLVFPRILSERPEVWQLDKVVGVSGKISDKDGEPKVICDKAAEINLDNYQDVFKNYLMVVSETDSRPFWMRKKQSVNQPDTQPKRFVTLEIHEPLDYEVSRHLKQIVSQHPGQAILQLLIHRRAGAKQKIKTSFKVSDSPELVQRLKTLF